MFFISFTSQELRAIVQVIFIILTNKKILNREIKNTDRNSISNFFISVSKTYLRFCLPAFRPPDLRSFSLRSLVIALKFS